MATQTTYESTVQADGGEVFCTTDPTFPDRITPPIQELITKVETEGATVAYLRMDVRPTITSYPIGTGCDRVLVPASEILPEGSPVPNHLVLILDGVVKTWVAREDDRDTPSFRLPVHPNLETVTYDVLLVFWRETPAEQYDRLRARRSQPSAGMANTSGELADCLDSNPFAFVNRLRRWNDSNYTREPLDSELLSEDSAWWGTGDWAGLLVIHGTALQSHIGLRHVDELTVKKLCARYQVGSQRRVIALDHKTLENAVPQNVRELADRLPKNRKIKLDILAISRGALVARYLAEGHANTHLASRGLTVEVRNIVFVGGANDGTPSAGRNGHPVDNLTTARCMGCRKCFSADNPTARNCDSLSLAEAGSAIAALLSEDGLQGQKDMRPDSELLRLVNRRDPTTGVKLSSTLTYNAIAGKYSCNAKKGGCFCGGNPIMGGVANDLVVPFDSVTNPSLGGDSAFRSGAKRFPISGTRLLETDRPHSELFKATSLADKLLAWLPGVPT